MEEGHKEARSSDGDAQNEQFLVGVKRKLTYDDQESGFRVKSEDDLEMQSDAKIQKTTEDYQMVLKVQQIQSREFCEPTSHAEPRQADWHSPIPQISAVSPVKCDPSLKVSGR